MKTFLVLFCLVLLVSVSYAQRKPKGRRAKQSATTTTTPAPGAQSPPTIDWGKCPQLEPKENEKESKASILDGCLKSNPIPQNLTQESVEAHQKQIAECALKKENWFDKNGRYRFSKAESEIKRKKLNTEQETKLIAHHTKCRKEAQEKYPQKANVIDMVQLYQACMDFHISETCEIKLVQQ